MEVLGGEAPLNIKWITLEKFQIDKSRGLEYLSNDNSIKERLQMEISTKKYIYEIESQNLIQD